MRAEIASWIVSGALLATGAAAAPALSDLAQRGVPWVGEAPVRALEAALLVSGQEGGEIRTAVLALPLRHARNGWRLATVIEMDGAKLVPETDRATAIDVVLYLLDEEGEIVSTAARRVMLGSPDHRRRVREAGLKIPIALPLPEGEHLLRVLVRSEAGAFGLRSVAVPPPGPLPAPALLAEPPESWLVGLEGEPRAPYPLQTGAEPFYPAALPVVSALRPSRGLLLIPSSDGRPETGPPRLTALFAANESELRAELEVELLGEARPTGLPGLEALPFSLLASGLGGGLYTVRLALERPGEERLLTPPSVLIVAPTERPTPWPNIDLDAVDSGRPARIAQRPDATAGGAERELLQRSASAIDAGFDTALARLDADDLLGAAEVLFEPRREAARTVPPDHLPELHEAESRRLAARLTERPESLLSLVCLYAELAARHLETSDPRSARHATREARRLADRAAAAPAPDREAVAAALVRVARAQSDRGMLGEAAESFRQALKLAPTALAPGLGLAATLEKQGRFAETADLLADLAQLHADHPETALRWAINLARSGRFREAREILARLSTDLDGWVGRLAIQEGARLAARHESSAEAERILRDGLARWPDDASIKLQLAWLLDHQRRPRAADALLAEVDAGEGGAASPRYRYNDWPRPASPWPPPRLAPAASTTPPQPPAE